MKSKLVLSLLALGIAGTASAQIKPTFTPASGPVASPASS